MAVFGGMTLTNKGLALQGKAQAGTQLNYTRIAIGDGSLSGQSVPALNALISLKKSLPIARLQMQPPNKVIIGTTLSNADITTGFYFREVGVFAQDPDGGEILYAYANAGVTADYIAPGGGTDIIEKAFDCVVVVGTAANIKAVIDESLVFAKKSELDTVDAAKVDKISGKGLSANDYTTTEKNKLSGITAGAGGAGSASDTVIGNRTISDTIAPTGDTGTITTLLGWLANMIKSITGKSSWRTAPATTLEAAKAHADDATRHLTAAERTAWNAKETPAGAQSKADAVQINLTAHTGNNTVHITAAERTTWSAKETPGGAQTKADAAQAAAIAAAAADATAKADAAATVGATAGAGQSIPLNQKGIAGGVATLDPNLNLVALGVKMGSTYTKKSFMLNFTGVANQKIDLIWATAIHGVIRISIGGVYSGIDSNGMLVKEHNIISSPPSTINAAPSYYSLVTGLIQNHLSIGEVGYDSTNSRFRIPIEARSAYINPYAITVEAWTSVRDVNFNISPAYTGVATILPVAVQAIPDNTVTKSGYEIQKHALTGNTGLGKGGNPTVSPNTLIETGMYTITFSSSDLPVAGSTTTVIVKRYNASYITQDADVFATVNTTTTVRKFTRESRNNGSSWSVWREISMKAAALPNNTDLNTLVNEGQFFAVSNASAATITNQPAVGGSYCFNLDVKTTVSADGTGCNQMITYYSLSASSPTIFTRNCYQSTWTAWQQIETTAAKNVANGYAGLDAAASVLPDNLPFGSVTNLLGDSGRFVGPQSEQRGVTCSDTFANNSFFSGWNGTTATSGGKFYHDNSTNGGTSGALNSDVVSLLAGITAVAGVANGRYGTEFHIASYTMGSGTANPNATVPTTYLMTVNSSFPAGGVNKCYTVSFWIRVKSGTRVVINKSMRFKKNGINQTTNVQLTPADGWVHIETVHGASTGYSNAAPAIHATPGDVVQIALPVVTAGDIGVGIHNNPVLGPIIGYTADTTAAPGTAVMRDNSGNITTNTQLSFSNDDGFVYDDATNMMYLKADGVNYTLFHNGNDGAGSGLDADLLDGKQLTEVVQGTLAYAVTTGTASALAASITPAPAALSAGLRVSIKAHAATTGPVTLNLNGLGAKSIKKPNGNNPPLALGGVYTVVYDGSAFILQGEGGEYGTAAAGQVLTGYSIGTETGLVAGVMPNRSGENHHMPALQYTVWVGDKVFLQPPNGWYSGESWVVAPATDIQPYNIPADKNILGIQGTMPRQVAYTAPASTAWDGNYMYVRIPQGAYQTTSSSGYPEIQLSAAQARADGNIVPSNIRNGTWIYGVLGSLVPDASGIVGVDYYGYPGAGVGGTFDIIWIPTCKYFMFGDYPTTHGPSALFTYATAGSPLLYLQICDTGGVVLNLITLTNTQSTSRIKSIYYNARARTVKICTEDYQGNTYNLPGNFNVNGSVLLRWQSVSSGTSSPYNGCTLSGNILYA